MMSTLERPSIRYAPCSETATSPVRNQPSRNAAPVASGRRQYSRNTVSPRTSISPGVPAGTGRPGGDRLAVDGGHRQEEGEVAAPDPGPAPLRVELRKHLAAGAGPQRAGEDVDDPVHVVQRQDQQDPVVRPPLPSGDEARH